MEWQDWLEKTEPTGLTARQKKLAKEIADGDKDDHTQYYTKASWELWLEKNNAIETSHKEGEKKHEWDGKFSSSNTKDEVKDEDDKAVSEEESLEELTDGKLEEVEKLKSWELWLEKDALTNRWIETIPKKPKNNAMEDSQNYSRQSTGARYDYDNRSKRSNKPKYSKLGDVGDVTGDTILTNEGEKTGKFSKNHNVGGSKSNALADSSKKRQQNAVTKKPTIPSTGEAPTGVEKSWELWLTKYEETKEDKRLALQLDEARAVTGKKVAPQKVKPETGEDAKMGEYSTITAEKFKSWSLWLEKQQGAGDARFGNQHLTGLDQEPVNNEEDEANILPEKEEKTNEKEEKQEETDNKPYKGLKDEKK